MGRVQTPPGGTTILDAHGNRGFTLLELIVVCFLIGIMLSIGAPSLRNAFFTNPLKSSARQMIGAINEVRQKAVRSQEPYYFHLSQIENRVWYEKATANTEAEEDLTEDDFDSDTQELQLPDSIRLTKIWIQDNGVSSKGETTLYISKKGYMEQAAIQLSDESGNSLSVRCNPFTDPMTVTEEFPSN